MAAASRPGVKPGSVSEGRSGHGRRSRPDTFTMRAASHRLKTLSKVANTAAAGGMATTRISISRLGSPAGRPGAGGCVRSARSKMARSPA